MTATIEKSTLKWNYIPLGAERARVAIYRSGVFDIVVSGQLEKARNSAGEFVSALARDGRTYTLLECTSEGGHLIGKFESLSEAAGAALSWKQKYKLNS